MGAAKVQASLRIRAVLPEPPLLAHISSESRGTFRQKARSLTPLNGWAGAVKICHDRMLEDTNSLDAAQFSISNQDTCLSDLKPIMRVINLIWATRWENLFMPYANNKGADQPVQPCSLISTFAVRYLDSIIPLVSTSKNSSLYLAS